MNRFKRRVSLLLVMTMVATSCFAGCGKKDQTRALDDNTEVAVQNIEQTTEAITTVVESEEYSAMTQEEKVEAVTEVLTTLAEEEVIDPESIKYDEGSGVVSYTYSDGGLGGVATTEFETVDEEMAEKLAEDISSSDIATRDVSGSDVSGSDVSGSDVSGSDVSGSDVSAGDVSGSDVSGGEPEITDEFRKVAEDTDFDETSSFPEDIEEIPVIIPENTDNSVSDNALVTDESESDSGYIDSSKINVMVLHGFESSRDRTYKSLERSLNRTVGADVNAVVDFTVKVEDLLEMPNFDVVLFSMHGSYMYDKNWKLSPVICLLDDVYTKDRLVELYDYYQRGDIGVFYSSSGETFFVIYPSFFTNNFAEGALKNTYVFSECCNFFGWCSDSNCDINSGVYCNNVREDFDAALSGRGCPLISGFHNSVMAYYSICFQNDFITLLVTGKNPVDAYITCAEEYGSSDKDYRSGTAYADLPNAYPLIGGADFTKEFERRTAQMPATVGEYAGLYLDVTDYHNHYIDDKGKVQIKPEMVSYFESYGGDGWLPAPMGTAGNLDTLGSNDRFTYFQSVENAPYTPQEYFNFYYEMICEDETDWDADAFYIGDGVFLYMVKYYSKYDMYSGIVLFRDAGASEFTGILVFTGDDLPIASDFASIVNIVK